MKGVCHYTEKPAPHVKVEVRLSGKHGAEIRDKFFPGSKRISVDLFREGGANLNGDEFKPTIEQMKEMDGKIISVDVSGIIPAQAKEPWEFLKDDPEIRDVVETDADHDANYLFFDPETGINLARQRFNFNHAIHPYSIRSWVNDSDPYADQLDVLIEECIKLRYKALYSAYSMYLERCDSETVETLQMALGGSPDEYERLPLKPHLKQMDPCFLGEALEMAYQLIAESQRESFLVMRRIEVRCNG